MSKKILLADDSITIQKVIELTFSDEDFDVVTVGNGRLALEKLPEVKPDIVLCDIIMPEKDGYEVCEQIKSSSTFSHVPVLLLTGAFEPFDQERATQVRSDGFLAKPFEPETLIAKVKDLLSRAGPATDAAPVASPVVEVVPPREPAAVSPGFIPDEPFAPIEAQDFEEASPAVADDAPLAAVMAEEAATLAGEVPSGVDARALAIVVTALLRGVAMQWALDARSIDVIAVKKEIRRLFELAFSRVAGEEV